MAPVRFFVEAIVPGSIGALPVDGSDSDDALDGLSWLFPERSINQHGGAGWGFRYRSELFGWMYFQLADPPSTQTFELFAHHLWNASIWMSNLIERSAVQTPFKNDVELIVMDKRVLELGAGAGLAGVMSAKAGASKVVISDYPNQVIVDNIAKNVKSNIPPKGKRECTTVTGLEWGELDTDFAKTSKNSFDLILAADCVWIFDQHRALIETMLWFLTKSDSGIVAMFAGFHRPKGAGQKNGRGIVKDFFEMCKDMGLIIDQAWEQHEDGQRRPHVWNAEPGFNDDRWTVCALMKRAYTSDCVNWE
ncbi:MAG: hypothetical protein M1814_002874 [Vezdaea aestivalis]|nr:MAG: hypothetical protein M1814_002874 [Vezdaea aestivalis]